MIRNLANRFRSCPAHWAAITGSQWRSTRRPGWSTSRRMKSGWCTLGYQQKDFKLIPMYWNLGVFPGTMPDVKGYLLAWDPVNQKEVWRVNYLGPWNGGVLTTAGNLVVQGNAAGDFGAYRADNGQKLWSTSTQSPVMAAPVSYAVDGEQYIAVLAGWGGIYPLTQGKQGGPVRQHSQHQPSARVQARGRGPPAAGPAPLAAHAAYFRPTPRMRPRSPPALSYSPSSVMLCHGNAAVGGGVIPDLRKSRLPARGRFLQHRSRRPPAA